MLPIIYMSVKSVLKLSCPARLGHPALMRSCWGCCRRAAAAEKTEEQFYEERRKALFDGVQASTAVPPERFPGGEHLAALPGWVPSPSHPNAGRLGTSEPLRGCWASPEARLSRPAGRPELGHGPHKH